jgi:hypothetical protein
MIEQNDIICHVRESFSRLHMDVPVEKVFAASRIRRRRRVSGLSAAAAAAAGAAVATTLALGGQAPAPGAHAATRTGNPPASGPGPVRLAAFSVAEGPGSSTTLTLHKGPAYPPLDPAAVRQALARRGIPALVTTGTFCRSTPSGSGDFSQILRQSDLADGSKLVIDGQAIPPGTELSIGYFSHYVRMALIKDGAPLTCSSTFDQPAVHLTPTGTPIRGRK